MRRFYSLLAITTVMCGMTAWGQALPASQSWKSSGRELRQAQMPQTQAGVRVPSKVDVYGTGRIVGQAEICPSAPKLPQATAFRTPMKAGEERKAQALLVFTDTKGSSNSIIELPLTVGTVESFNVVAEKVPSMPYKAYGEKVEAAVAMEGKFVASTFCSMIYAQTNYVYTSADWKLQYQYDYRIADLTASATTYNAVDGMTYGSFLGRNPATGNDEYFFGKWIDPTSYTQPQPISWLGKDNVWYGMAATPEGVLYAIDKECNLLKVDPATGATTLIGATGLENKYMTSACYDPESRRILFATSLDAGSSLNSIDPATGRATILYNMPDGEQIVGLFIPQALAADDAPAAATDISSNFMKGENTGNITFNVPNTLFGGGAPTGTVNYEVRLEGEVIATGTANYGTKVSVPVTIEKSEEKVVSVRLSNAAGKSPLSYATLFLGTPVPRSPYFTAAAEWDEAAQTFSLKWSPMGNTAGVTGGFVINDDLTWELTRYPDKKVITLGKGVTEYVDHYTPGENLQLVYYELCAVYHGQKSAFVRSSVKRFGVIIPPYLDEMWSSVSAAAYTYITTGTDKNNWSYIGPVSEQEKQHGWMNHGAANATYNMDSYLVMAPVKLEKGKVYTLNFTAACTNTSWRNERLAVYLGRDVTSPAALKEVTLMPPTLIYSRREENGERHSCNIQAPADGLYYISFHHCSGPKLRYLYIGDISITAPMDVDVPAEVTDLTVKAATNGALKVDLRFYLPTKTIGGTNLAGKAKVKIYRNDAPIADLSPQGTACSYTDNTPENGVNTYVIVPYNDKGDGMKTTANVFVGVGKPVNPSGVYAWTGDNDGQSLVRWNSVTRDEFNTVLSTANVRYDVQRETVLSNGSVQREVVAENLTSPEFKEQVCAPDADQMFVSYWVRAVTAGGVSQWVSTRRIPVGKPHIAPWSDSFKDGSVEFIWNTVGSDIQWGAVDDTVYDDVKSVDGDNGFLVAVAKAAGSETMLYTGGIVIPEDMPNPVLSLYYLDQDNYHGTPVHNTIELIINDGSGFRTLKAAVCNGPWGWTRMACDVSAYKGKKVQVGVYGCCVDRPNLAIDAFRIASRLEHDIDMVSIAGPAEIEAGQDANLTVSFENLGNTDIPAGYHIDLYRGDNKIATKEGPAIKIDARATVNFTDATNPTLGNEVKYHAVVVFDGDDNPANNTSNTCNVSLLRNEGYPEPTTLQASRTPQGVALAWSEPDMSKTPRKQTTETFEGFDAFAKTIPGWTILDRDMGIVQPISNYIQVADTWGSPFGFFVQDCSVAPFNEFDEFTPHSGNKYMAAQPVVDENGNAVQNDDWLISPELSGHKQVAQFMGKSISSSWPESFEVYYSTTGTDVADFTIIGGVIGAPNAWVSYTVTLPEGAKYFAIRCNSFSCLQFMVDDVTLRLAASDPINLSFVGYNVYRDGQLLTPTPILSTNYVDAQADNGKHEYHVTAVYDEGESVPSEASTVEAGIGSVNVDTVSITAARGVITVTAPQGTPVVIYNAAGQCLHTAQGSTAALLPAGIYVVRAGTTVRKVALD